MGNRKGLPLHLAGMHTSSHTLFCLCCAKPETVYASEDVGKGGSSNGVHVLDKSALYEAKGKPFHPIDDRRSERSNGVS